MLGRARTYPTLAVCVVLGGLLACAPPPSNGSGPSSSGSGGASSGGETSNGGHTTNGGNGSGNIDFGLGGIENTRNPDAGCVSTPSAAEQVVRTVTTTVEVPVTTYSPVDMYIMYDQSGSMNDENNGVSRWDAVKNALIGFVQSPESADIGVGIQYFPLSPPPCTGEGPGCACVPFSCLISCLCWATGGGSCTVADYATPDVPIGLLPGVAQDIIDSVNNHDPGGGTPTLPALQGAHQYAAQWATANPDRKTIVVLATDGNPNDCSSDVQGVANVAAAGFAATPSVPTFVIGVGSSLTSLDAIAAAGGTNQAIIVDDASGDPTQQFLDAMNQIREEVTEVITEIREEEVVETVPVECEWVIPEMPDGITFNKNEVNVAFSAGADGAPQTIGYVPSPDECANVGSGWYYDNDADPSKVLVCDQTCSTIQSIDNARVNVVFGCATEPAIPR